MELIRITAQARESVGEFYAREAREQIKLGNHVMGSLLEFMHDCLKVIQSTIDRPPVFAVTSHYRLRLISGDNYVLPTLVTLEPVIDGPKNCAIQISYELPQAEAPWPFACVSGIASHSIEAAEMVRVALTRNAYAVVSQRPM